MVISILHSMTAVFLAFYGFLFKRSNFDYFILFITYTTCLSWCLYKGECPLSYYLKKYKDPTYVIGSNVSSDDMYVLFGPKYVPLLKIFFTYLNPLVQTANLYILFKRQHFSVGVTLLYPLFFYFYTMNRGFQMVGYNTFSALIFTYVLYDIIRAFMQKMKLL